MALLTQLIGLTLSVAALEHYRRRLEASAQAVPAADDASRRRQQYASQRALTMLESWDALQRIAQTLSLPLKARTPSTRKLAAPATPNPALREVARQRRRALANLVRLGRPDQEGNDHAA